MLMSRVEIIEEIERQIRKWGGQHSVCYVVVAEDRRDNPGSGSSFPDEDDGVLVDFSALAIVDQEGSYTILGGRLSPTSSIDLINTAVILSVGGAMHLFLSLPPGSFSKTGLGGYVTSVRCGLQRTDILLQPFSSGYWAYSVGIEGFVPGSTPVTASLTIGSQAGRATVEVYAF